MNIDDDLLARAKVMAASTHRRLGQVIDDALRAMVARDDSEATAPRQVVLPTDGGSGLQPGVDLEDKAALAALLGDDQVLHAAG